MGAYPRGTGLNPAEGKWVLFPSCRRLYLSSFSDTKHTTVILRVYSCLDLGPETSRLQRVDLVNCFSSLFSSVRMAVID